MIGPILLAGLFFYLINMDGERFFYTFVKLEQQPIMNRITLFALLSIFCLCSCNSEKDDILPNPINEIEEEPCLWDAYVTKVVNQDTIIDFTTCPSELAEYYPDPYRYEYPVFNPNNPDQIAYLRRDNSSLGPSKELWTFDFCTGEQKFLLGDVFFDLDWSVKDWLLFTRLDNQIWKIKANGDSLTQVTCANGISFRSRWHPTGEGFLFSLNSLNGYSLYANECGIYLDTFSQINLNLNLAWKDDTHIYSWGSSSSPINDRGIFEYNTVDNSLELITPLSFDSFLIYDIEVNKINKDELYWLNQTWMIGKSNSNVPDYDLVVVSADNRRYEYIALAPDHSKLLVTRIDQKQISICELEVRKSLYYFDLQTMEEYAIHLPE
jgi:hypothetical protein